MAYTPPKNIVLNKGTQDKIVPNNTAALHQKSNLVQQEQLKKTVGDNYTFTPSGVHIEDMDLAVKEWGSNNFNFLDKTKKYFFADIQRFSQFMKTWENTDTVDTETLPFILINRFSVPEYGSLFNGSFNLPNKATYTLIKNEELINGKKHVIYYEIPQPTNIDLNYEITIYANHRRDINKFNEEIIQNFKAGQLYVNVLGHNMPLKLNQNSDNSHLETENRKYLSHTYNIQLKGFILNEEDFVIKDSINGVLLDLDTCTVKNTCEIKKYLNHSCEQTIEFNFNRKSNRNISYTIENNINIISTNNDNIDLYVNNTIVTLPYSANKGDILSFIIPNYNKNINFSLYGNV